MLTLDAREEDPVKGMCCDILFLESNRTEPAKTAGFQYTTFQRAIDEETPSDQQNLQECRHNKSKIMNTIDPKTKTGLQK